MKLNPDLVREILLTIEEKQGFRQTIIYNKHTRPKYESLLEYEYSDVLYHMNQCKLSGLILCESFPVTESLGCHITDISPRGHEFLANIRTESIWNKTKETAKKVGSFSLGALAQIAIDVVSASINDHI